MPLFGQLGLSDHGTPLVNQATRLCLSFEKARRIGAVSTDAKFLVAVASNSAIDIEHRRVKVGTTNPVQVTLVMRCMGIRRENLAGQLNHSCSEFIGHEELEFVGSSGAIGWDRVGRTIG